MDGRSISVILSAAFFLSFASLSDQTIGKGMTQKMYSKQINPYVAKYRHGYQVQLAVCMQP